MTDLKTPVIVEIDIPVTRRTKIHAVVTGDGDQVFHSRRLSQVLDFLLEHEVETFELLDEDHEYMIKLSRPKPTQRSQKG